MLQNALQNENRDSIEDNIKISVIGYDETGISHAMNLRDSGFDVTVGVRPGKSWERASKDGFEVFSISDAVEISDIVSVTLPQEIIPDVYNRSIRDFLGKDRCIIFSDASCLSHGTIEIPGRTDAFALITCINGKKLREKYLAGLKINTYTGEYRCCCKKNRDIVNSYAKGIGSADSRIFENDIHSLAAARIFADEEFRYFLEYIRNTAVSALSSENTCTELSQEIISMVFSGIANREYDPLKPHTAENRQHLSQFMNSQETTEDIISRMLEKTKSGESFREKLLKNI